MLPSPIPPSPTPPSADITFEQIRERAYDLWERHHRPPGFDIELWLMAERELRAERMARTQDVPQATPLDDRTS
jgi:hypothetical protein